MCIRNTWRPFFDKERYGPYKSDICRLSTLYEGGGYYFDNDFEVSQDVRPLLPSNISLSTVLELDSTRNIFQACERESGS